MLTGREQETAFLENHYKRTGSQILVVYGQRGVGKTALLTAFAEKNRPSDIPLPTALPGKCAISGDRSLENRGKRFHGTLPGKKYYSVYPEKKVIAKKF